VLWLQWRGRCLLVQRPAKGVWAGLWSLPEFDSREALNAQAAAWPGHGQWLPTIEHALTHFDWSLTPLCWQWPARGAGPAGFWVEPSGRWALPEEALALGLAAPVRRLLQSQPLSRR